jgi:hypothetical protein
VSDLELFKKLDADGESLAELDAIVEQLRGPVREPGDIDSYQIMARYGMKTEKTAKALMRKIAATGQYEYIKVNDQDRGKAGVWVLRLKGDGDV